MNETGTVRNRLRLLLAAGALVILALIVIAVVATTTGGSCNEAASASLTVTVTDTSGRNVCDAEVSATDGSEVFVLQSSGCSYAGPWERTGTYVVTAASAGRTVVSEPITVEAGDCGVEPERVELSFPA